ncbi:MAG: arylesterase [Gammaproteobacteria bacterium]|nr:arylesterase [Gammaproteobacteria bacterium]
MHNSINYHPYRPAYYQLHRIIKQANKGLWQNILIGIVGLWCGLCTIAQAAEPLTPSKKILIVGDSLGASYGVATESSWANLLSNRLAQQSPAYSVINASISGDTSSSARSRLPALLAQHQPNIVIIELGGNDGLRGLPVEMIERNLSNMVETTQASNAKVLLLGITLPKNYGTAYIHQFDKMYHKLAKNYHVSVLPFLLKDIAGHAGMMQNDGIHPTAAAQPKILENIWPLLKPLL